MPPSKADESLREVAKELERTLRREYFENRTVALALSQDGHMEGIGSGICVVVGDRYLICTAGHVLEEARANDAELVLVGNKDKTIEISSIPQKCIHLNRILDVAYLEIDSEAAITLGKKFISLNYILGNISHIGDNLFLVTGFPWAFRRAYPIGSTDYHRNITKPFRWKTVTVAPDEWPREPKNIFKHLSEEYHIVLKYARVGILDSTEEYTDVPDPEGMSGGGVWTLSLSRSGIWSLENARLVGIFHSFYRDSLLLTATQIQHWLNIIADRFPDLTSVIHDHLSADKSI